MLRDALGQAGEPAPDRQAEVLLYRMVNYESDNLVFAEIYATFMAAALSPGGFVPGLADLELAAPASQGRGPLKGWSRSA